MLAGGRYDGLIESLGGNPTPGVGWAAGIERLAMLIEEPKADLPWLIVVVEDDELQAEGIRILSALRRSIGLPVEIVAGGSVKKRYDKATKLGANATLSLNANLLSSGECAKIRLREIPGRIGLTGDLRETIQSAISSVFELGGSPNDLALFHEVGLRPKSGE